MNFVLGHKELMDGHEKRSGVDPSAEAQPGSGPLGASGDGSPPWGPVLNPDVDPLDVLVHPHPHVRAATPRLS